MSEVVISKSCGDDAMTYKIEEKWVIEEETKLMLQLTELRVSDSICFSFLTNDDRVVLKLPFLTHKEIDMATQRIKKWVFKNHPELML